MTTTVRPLGELATKLISILLTITLIVSFTSMAYAVEAGDAGDEVQSEVTDVAVDELTAEDGSEAVQDETAPTQQETAAPVSEEVAEPEATADEPAVEEAADAGASTGEPVVELEIPAALTGEGDKAVQAVNGDGFYAVLLNDGTLWMWGDNAYGQIAHASDAVVEAPTKVFEEVVTIAAGASHMVVLKSDGTVWTWGKNDKGQLGNGTLDEVNAPIQVLEHAVAVFAKGDDSGVQLQDGTYRAWGLRFAAAPSETDGILDVAVRGASPAISVSGDGDVRVGDRPCFELGSWIGFARQDENPAKVADELESDGLADIQADNALLIQAESAIEDDLVLATQASGITTAQIQAVCARYSFYTNWYWRSSYKTGSDWTGTYCDENYTASKAYRTHEYKYAGCYQCQAFARFLARQVSGYAWNNGAKWNSWTLSSKDVLQPGDLIIHPNHSAMVYSVSNGKATFAECWGDSGNKLSIGKSGFNNRLTSASAIASAYRGAKLYRFNGAGPDPTPTCKAPSLAPFDVIGGKKIRIDNNESGATMRYTIDGKTNPSNTVGTVYNGQWIDDEWTVMGVRAIAYKSGSNNSPITYLTNHNATTKAPTIKSSANASGARVEIASATKAATIVYTLDGSAPKWDLHNQKPSNGTKYTGAFNISKNCTVKAIALASGSVASSVTTSAIEILPPAKPEIRAAAGKVALGNPIRILWSKDGAASSYSVTFYDDDTAVATKKSESSEATYIPTAPGTYTARAKAINKVGESEQSDPVTVQVMADRTVRFVDKTTNGDGETVIIPLDEQKVKWGYSATKPASTPKKKGYTFAGWDRSLSNITEDVDIAAQWEVNKYVVRFYSADGSRQLKRQVVEYGKSAEAPDPDAPATGYVFSGWTVTEADADSTRDFTQVDSNMKLRAVYAWGDEELPVVAAITQAQRTASGNYTVKVKLTNYPNDLTTALLRVALKTSAGKLVQTSRETVELASDGSVEKTITLKYNGDYVATVAEVEVVGIDGNYRTGGAYSEAVTANVTSSDDFSYSNWSAWTTTKPTASDTVEVESAIQYRYRDKQTTTSTATSLSGWTRDGTSKTTYGSWVTKPTTTSKPNEGETLRITGTSTKYNYFHYCNKDSSAVGGWSQDSVKYGSSNLYHTLSSTSKLTARYIADRGGRKDSCTGSKCAYGYTTWWLGSTTTTYTYQTRTKTVTYGYYKWGSWSDYGFDETAASASREVEKRTVYRSRTKIPNEIKGTEDTSGTTQSVSGTLNTGTDLAGKQATIMVYNVTNSDPNEDQIQYIGQTTIGAGNAYSFEFIPRSDPSAESGDFIVALGVKGATGLVNVATIKAPRPEYQVTFQYEKEDGTIETIGTQKVAEGDDALLPDSPVREGCRFLGWSTTVTRVNDNLVVNALFSPRVYTVVWVDHQSEDVFVETYEHGQKLSAPEEAPAYDGYTFKGWDALLDGSEVMVNDDMVLTAVFEPVEHTVFFANADGSVFKKVKVQHGEAAELPDENPTVDGMDFIGWDTSAGTPWWNVMDDMIVKPLFAYENTVSSPFSTVELADGYVSSVGAKVFLETSTEGAEILYTTDGSDPTTESAVYQADKGIVVKEPTTIRAMAVAAEMNDSSITDIEVNVTATNDVENAEAGIAEAPFFYGEAVEPGVMVWFGDDLLEYGTDYTIDYSNNTAVGTGEALVKGMGDYMGQQVVYFDIVEAPEDEASSGADIANADIYVPDATYTGQGLTPEPVIVVDGKHLVAGTDFVVSYSGNTQVGNGTVVVVGIGGYTGVATKTFKINDAASGGTGSGSGSKADISAAQATVADQVYTGKALTPALTLTLDGKTLVAGKDFAVAYLDNIAAGKGMAVAVAAGSYTGAKVISFRIDQASISNAKVNKVKAQKLKKGKAVKPNPVVKFNGKKLKKGTDYTVKYKNNKKKGTGKIIITGKGNFKGSKTVKFKIK